MLHYSQELCEITLILLVCTMSSPTITISHICFSRVWRCWMFGCPTSGALDFGECPNVASNIKRTQCLFLSKPLQAPFNTRPGWCIRRLIRCYDRCGFKEFHHAWYESVTWRNKFLTRSKTTNCDGTGSSSPKLDNCVGWSDKQLRLCYWF